MSDSDWVNNVYIKYADGGSWGKRVAEMKIVFISDEEEREQDVGSYY